MRGKANALRIFCQKKIETEKRTYLYKSIIFVVRLLSSTSVGCHVRLNFFSFVTTLISQ